MIEIPFKVYFGNTQFLGLVGRLSDHRGFGQHTLYRLKKIKDKIEREGKVASEQYQKILKTYALYDENGEIVQHEVEIKAPDGTVTKQKTGRIKFKEGVDEKKFHEEMEELKKVTFKVEQHKITAETLVKAGLMTLDDGVGRPEHLTLQEIEALDPILDWEGAVEAAEARAAATPTSTAAPDNVQPIAGNA